MSLNIFRWDIWIPWRIDFLAAPRQHISFADRSSPSYSSTGPTATGVVASAEPGRLRFIGWSSSFSRLGASSRVMAALCWCGCGVYLVNMVPSSLPSRLSTMASRLVGVNSWRLFCPLRLGFVGVVRRWWWLPFVIWSSRLLSVTLVCRCRRNSRELFFRGWDLGSMNIPTVTASMFSPQWR